MVGCGQTSAKWLPSTMRLPPSTRPSGSRERRSSAFIREDSGLPNVHKGGLNAGTFARGWMLVEQGEEQQGIVLMRRGLAARHNQGGKIGDPYCLSLLAEAYGKVGQVGEGITLAAEQLARIKETGERVWEAELYRVMGSLLLRKLIAEDRNAVAEVEACFLQALSVAGNQGAKSLELRAAMCLAGLWQNAGKKAEARQVVENVFDWFTEGFDTRDLTEA